MSLYKKLIYFLHNLYLDKTNYLAYSNNQTINQIVKMNPLGNWADRENIIIRNNIPYYNVDGTSYRDVYKNGLSLDEVCFMLPCDYNLTKHTEQCDIPVSVKPINHEVMYTEYPIDTYSIGTKTTTKTKTKTKKEMNRFRKTRIGRRVKLNKLRVLANDNKYMDTYDTNCDTFDILESKLNEEKREKAWLKWWKEQEKELEDYDKWEDMDKWMDPDMYPSCDDW